MGHMGHINFATSIARKNEHLQVVTNVIKKVKHATDTLPIRLLDKCWSARNVILE